MQIREDVPLAPHTTLRIGGPARFFAQAHSEPELLEALHFARSRSLPVFVLGGGSNLLVADAGFAGLVLQPALDGAVRTQPAPNDTNAVDYVVPAGFDWDALVQLTCRAGATGLECLAGIPGSVGASPVQNIGAYGQEVAQTITQVRVLDRQTLVFTDLPAAACAFAYRTSVFNSTARDRYVVTQVTFRLRRDAPPSLRYADLQRHFAPAPAPPTALEVYHAVRAIRGRKGMVLNPGDTDPDLRSAGSFFKNPVVPAPQLQEIATALTLEAAEIPHWQAGSGLLKLPAAWLIERAGFPRGFALGAAGISTRHTLALVNRSGTATCADLLHLRDTIVSRVQQRFGVALEQEPVLLG